MEGRREGYIRVSKWRVGVAYLKDSGQTEQRHMEE